MTSRATVRRSGAMVPDPNDPEAEIPGWTPVDADVPCWVDKEGPTAGTRSVSSGGVDVQVATRILKIPHDRTGWLDGDVVLISGGACDGRFFRIVEATFADQKKQQELTVTEISRPEGWS